METQHDGSVAVTLINVVDTERGTVSGVDVGVMRLEGIISEVAKSGIRRSQYLHVRKGPLVRADYYGINTVII